MKDDLFSRRCIDTVGALIVVRGFIAKRAHDLGYDFAVLRRDHEVDVKHIAATVPAIQGGFLCDSLRAHELDISIAQSLRYSRGFTAQNGSAMSIQTQDLVQVVEYLGRDGLVILVRGQNKRQLG